MTLVGSNTNSSHVISYWEVEDLKVESLIK